LALSARQKNILFGFLALFSLFGLQSKEILGLSLSKIMAREANLNFAKKITKF
jgi:hypothetical protein